MDAVERALWYVESHSSAAISLVDVAAAVDVSPYYLTRAFAAVNGTSLMKYLRLRRLSEAAKRLASGERNILRIALDCGYASHEAFTRAFTTQFNQTPEQVRTTGDLASLQLMEPITMSAESSLQLSPPRIEVLPDKRLAGLVQRYDGDSPAGIPAQWQRFSQYVPHIEGTKGSLAYGVCHNVDDDGMFDYLCGVEVNPESRLPDGLVTLPLPQQRYAAFSHAGHISEIRSVFAAVWRDGLASAGLEATPGPSLEVYNEQFDPVTGNGGYEVWVAIK